MSNKHNHAKLKRLYSPENEIAQITAGHMQYAKHIIRTPSGEYLFAKHHDPQKFTDSVREQHSRQYLQKEHSVYTHLATHGFVAIPAHAELFDDTALLLEGLPYPQWQWRAPDDETQRSYIQDTFKALKQLQSVPVIEHALVHPAHDTLHNEGWLNYPLNKKLYAEYLNNLLDNPAELVGNLEKLYQEYIQGDFSQVHYFTHHDLRQSNIAWNANHGVKIVDWSWAGAGLEQADSTSFLIDLAKSGIDVSEYSQYFNPAHALLLIGLWVEHSTWPTHGTDNTVRVHQARSAAVANQLFKRFGQ